KHHQNVFSDESMCGSETFYYPGDIEGKRAAERIHSQLISMLSLEDLGVKGADLFVLRETNNPSILVNIAFLSNPEEERLLSEPSFRYKAAKAILNGLEEYYQE